MPAYCHADAYAAFAYECRRLTRRAVCLVPLSPSRDTSAVGFFQLASTANVGRAKNRSGNRGEIRENTTGLSPDLVGKTWSVPFAERNLGKSKKCLIQRFRSASWTYFSADAALLDRAGRYWRAHRVRDRIEATGQPDAAADSGRRARHCRFEIDSNLTKSSP